MPPTIDLSNWLKINLMNINEVMTDGLPCITFNVKVSPNARQTKWLGFYGENLKVSINATPEKGKANSALIAFIAEECSVPKKNIAIISGETNTLKKIKISNLTKIAFIKIYEYN